jgi:hypothetical protein
MNSINWNGTIPKRRYAIFNTILHGDYMIVVKEDDIERAERWGGFIQWVGGVRQAEKRTIKKGA